MKNVRRTSFKMVKVFSEHNIFINIYLKNVVRICIISSTLLIFYLLLDNFSLQGKLRNHRFVFGYSVAEKYIVR